MKDRGKSEALLKELDEWVKTQKVQKNSVKLAFLAAQDDIETALGAGYSMKTIWRFLKEKNLIECRYESFMRLAKEHLGNPSKSSAAHPRSEAHSTHRRQAEKPAPSKQDQEPSELSITSAKEFTINHQLSKKDMF